MSLISKVASDAIMIYYQIGIVSEKQYEIGKKFADFLPNWNCFYKAKPN